MGMDVEVIEKTWYTVHLKSEDVEKVKKFMKNNEDRLPHGKTEVEEREQENFCYAVENLLNNGEINLLIDRKTNKGSYIEKIDWSESEERTVKEILGE